ncbi:MAG: DEAD/DEAH box helicase family protein [Polyangia bacterium]
MNPALARFAPAGATRDAVRPTHELERVKALPRRAPVDLSSGSVRAAALVELMTSRLRRPDRPVGAACGCEALGRRCLNRLLPAQAWALYEAPFSNGGRGGLLAPIGVGSGKTVLNILVPMVIPDCKVVALLLPPGLVEQLVVEYKALREHFVVPSLVLPTGRESFVIPGRPVVHVVPYSRFSRSESTTFLEQLRPDTILADEVHCLKNREAIRTGRVLRYFAAQPNTRLCGWSGTITSKSVNDFSHLSAFALGEGSPLPLDPDEADCWAAALDPSDWPAPPGALAQFCAVGETPLQAVGRRIRETRGVVSTLSASGVDASIILTERRPPRMPETLVELIRDVRASWMRPDGEELVDAMAVGRCVQQLACGFYYRWRFPSQPSMESVEAWFAARKAWGKEIREKLKDPRPHLDSPMLLANAAQRFHLGEAHADDRPTWASETWARWRDVKNTIRHETEAVWVDEYLATDAAAWASKNRGIVWYEHAAFGHRVAELSGLPLHGGGPGAEARILAEKGDRSIVASMASHGEGRNGLQFLFKEQLVTTPPPSGKEWEQLLGRLHRVGQTADEVTTHVYRHTPELADAIDRAVSLTKYVEGLLSANQKLLSATVEWCVL